MPKPGRQARRSKTIETLTPRVVACTQAGQASDASAAAAATTLLRPRPARSASTRPTQRADHVLPPASNRGMHGEPTTGHSSNPGGGCATPGGAGTTCKCRSPPLLRRGSSSHGARARATDPRETGRRARRAERPPTRLHRRAWAAEASKGWDAQALPLARAFALPTGRGRSGWGAGVPFALRRTVGRHARRHA